MRSVRQRTLPGPVGRVVVVRWCNEQAVGSGMEVVAGAGRTNAAALLRVEVVRFVMNDRRREQVDVR